MKRVLIAVAVLFSFATVALAQERPINPATTADISPNPAPQPSANPTPPVQPSVALSPIMGNWQGPWGSEVRSRAQGEMEVEMSADGGNMVTGRVKVTYKVPINCSDDWVVLTGKREDEKVIAQYDLGGRCGKIEAMFWIDPKEEVLMGTYKTKTPSHGNFRLTRQAPPAIGSTR